MSQGCAADLRARDTHKIADEQDIAALEGGPIEIGAHTASHPSLPALDLNAQLREIEESRSRCLELTGVPPSCFAYPFGDFDSVSRAAVRSAGFDLAVTTEPGVVRPSTDPMCLPRIAAENVSAERLLESVP
jgi:peptidoglycan/xylan/chitin deacetylase (PgdA/CDA1 family)